MDRSVSEQCEESLRTEDCSAVRGGRDVDSGEWTASDRSPLSAPSPVDVVALTFTSPHHQTHRLHTTIALLQQTRGSDLRSCRRCTHIRCHRLSLHNSTTPPRHRSNPPPPASPPSRAAVDGWSDAVAVNSTRMTPTAAAAAAVAVHTALPPPPPLPASPFLPSTSSPPASPSAPTPAPSPSEPSAVSSSQPHCPQCDLLSVPFILGAAGPIPALGGSKADRLWSQMTARDIRVGLRLFVEALNFHDVVQSASKSKGTDDFARQKMMAREAMRKTVGPKFNRQWLTALGVWWESLPQAVKAKLLKRTASLLPLNPAETAIVQAAERQEEEEEEKQEKEKEKEQKGGDSVVPVAAEQRSDDQKPGGHCHTQPPVTISGHYLVVQVVVVDDQVLVVEHVNSDASQLGDRVKAEDGQDGGRNRPSSSSQQSLPAVSERNEVSLSDRPPSSHSTATLQPHDGPPLDAAVNRTGRRRLPSLHVLLLCPLPYPPPCPAPPTPPLSVQPPPPLPPFPPPPPRRRATPLPPAALRHSSLPLPWRHPPVRS